jgi:hypothetical protein
MAVHGTPSRPSPSRPSPSHPSPSPLRLHQHRVAIKTSIAVTSLSSRPSPSHCAVYCRAARSRVVHRRCHRAVHRRRVAPSPSSRSVAVALRQAVHRRCVAVKPTIAKPSRHPSPSRPSLSHSSPSPSPSRFHQRPVAVTMSIAAASL